MWQLFASFFLLVVCTCFIFLLSTLHYFVCFWSSFLSTWNVIQSSERLEDMGCLVSSFLPACLYAFGQLTLAEIHWDPSRACVDKHIMIMAKIHCQNTNQGSQSLAQFCNSCSGLYAMNERDAIATWAGWSLVLTRSARTQTSIAPCRSHK